MPKSEEILHVSYLDAARAKNITAFCEENHLDYLMYTAQHICYTEGSERIVGYVRYNKGLLADARRNHDFAVPLRSMNDVSDKDYAEAIKILVLGSASMLSEISNLFNIDQKLTIISSGVGLIDIMAHATTKGDAVRDLARRLAIPIERVAVFGDSPNDVSTVSYTHLDVYKRQYRTHLRPRPPCG